MKMHIAHKLLQAVLFAVLACGCTRKVASTTSDAGADAAAVPVRDAGASSIPAPAFTALTDAGVDPNALPQPASEELTQRMHHLLDAMAQNNADLARDTVFPREAYLDVRDAKDAGKAWDNKLMAPFKRQLARAAHMKGADKAKYVEFELGHTVVRSTARKHDFKVDLWHVKHSRVLFTIDGKPHHLDIAEMTAYKGSWYITRL
jgi:hypothetical protein